MAEQIKSRLSRPRIPPVEEADWDDEVRALLSPERRPKELGQDEAPVYNVFKTLAHYPKMMKRMSPWGSHLLFKSSLPPREREMVILRTGWLCGAVYEWGHHKEIALSHAGVTVGDIETIKTGPSADGISREDADLLTAVDQLVNDHFVQEAVWAPLAQRFDVPQMMDLVFTVGHYASMCMALNSFGVQLEPGFDI